MNQCGCGAHKLFLGYLHYGLFVKYHSTPTWIKPTLVAILFVKLLAALMVCNIAG